MLDLFVSGYDEVTFEPDELDPSKQVLSAKMSAAKQGALAAAGDNDLTGITEGQFVPDPPCILPFEDDDKTVEKVVQDYEEIQQYWKNYANFLDDWPGVRFGRENMESFRNLWSNRPLGSRLRAFCVITPNSVGVRYIASLDDDRKNGQVLRPGQCVAVEAIKEEADGEQRFLKLPGPGAGWVFQQKDGVPVMAEMKSIEPGMWWYRVVYDKPVEVRKCPTFDDKARTGFLLSPKEVTMVNLRCKVDGYMFFHLMDGRGWVFELQPGSKKNDKNRERIVFMQCDDDFVDGGDTTTLKSLVPPTNEVVEVGLWTYVVNIEPVLAIGTKRNGVYLKPGDVVKVDKRANSNGNPPGLGGPGVQNRRWLRLGGNQGWVPETDERGKKLLLEQFTDEVSYPSWFKQQSDVNTAKEPWHIGCF
jgi:hypothetical protein